MAFNKRVLVGAFIACILAAFIPYYLVSQYSILTITVPAEENPIPKFAVAGQSPACIALAAVLSESVYSDHHPTFSKSINSYWSLNACEAKPACIVQPQRAQDVAAAVTVLRSEFGSSNNSAASMKFAVRSGGHSPEIGFANINGGVVIDMSLVNEVTVSADQRSAVIGVGARWLDVSSKLDEMNLAIVGGRNSDVGVGGLVLGGGISFFSPRFGMVCDNVDEYEIVLANGTIARATSTQHEDLWRALKGGTGNFGIVTRVTLKTFAAGKIWAGYAYWTGWQAPKVLEAFFNFNKPENFDKFAAGPIVALVYVQQLGMSLTAGGLAYTKPEKWARVFGEFNSLWRLWSTAKVQSLSDATRELDRLAPSGKRQFQATMTITNDLETIEAIRKVYDSKLKHVNHVRGSVWTLAFQPLSAAVTRKGNPNVLGFESRPSDHTLIIVLVTVLWSDGIDDELVHRVSREIIAESEDFAQSKGTADPYRYLNYAASGQDPIRGYGAENKRFLQAVSRKYDPSGFFQQAKQGGFKLDLYLEVDRRT